MLKDDLATKANIVIDPSELQAVTMDDLEEEDESANTTAQRASAALAIGGALARPSWLSSPTLGRANRFLSTAAVSLMNPRRPLGALEKVKVRSLSVEQRTEDDIEGHHGNDGLLLGRPPEEMELPITENSLLEILDGAVMMYNLSVHQQLGKMVGVSDDVNEYALALKDTEEKIKRCPQRRPDILEELKKSQQVFLEKLNHLSRRLAWINVTIYSKEKMQDIYWLLQVCLRSIQHSDRTGALFSFMPEFYLNVAMNSYNSLKNYFSPVSSMEELPGYEDTLTCLAAILAKHFADARIVGTDIKDSLMQALASYVCYPHSLRAVERISEEQQISMMKNLLAPYEQRPWAQTNWILVRLWRIQQAADALGEELCGQSAAEGLRTCFDLSVSLLRVLEMTVTLIPRHLPRLEPLVIRNFSSDAWLRLFYFWKDCYYLLLNQVLNRVTAERNLFDRVVTLRLPGVGALGLRFP
ncbi:unnamed protein product [Ranitomeya imitator]|uniref:E3 ubiquitin-protein ligase RNF123/RKP TPR repeat domain-containing protein n=1 Tax=Ranitomeya imitator TaxID=111125 RepID=A0ABN9LQ14_9NEOB|nr:unnamed protein product [Ranitomeya imitator]